jgi:carbonic anhydrase
MCVICGVGPGRRALLGGLAAGLVAAGSARAQGMPEERPATPEAALERLQAGNARYAANQPLQRDFSAGRAARAAGQAPFAAVLGCADSRVAPELVFDQNPGDLFVVRVAGNFVTPDGLASLEFGARVLGTRIIMVLGHDSCGAVNATVARLQDPQPLPGHIGELVDAMKPGIAPALRDTGPDLANRAVIANVRHNVQRLAEATPVLTEMVVQRKLRIVGGVYQLATGRVTLV